MFEQALKGDERAVVYYRVSTDKQGEYGLGMSAQREAVERWLGGREPLGTYWEVESGKKVRNRPKLLEALEHARREGAVLVIAKLDRLARNVAFIANLMESGVQFVACDMPMANRFTLHILAAVAEHESRMISERTKAAIAQAKKRGVKFGCANPKSKLDTRARIRGGKASGPMNYGKRRKPRDLGIVSAIMRLRGEGQSYRKIQAYLRSMGLGEWHVSQIWRMATQDERDRQWRQKQTA